MQDIKVELAKISTRQETILEKIAEQSNELKLQSKILADQRSTLDKQHTSLDHHILRTNQNEEAIDHIRLQTATLLDVADSIKRRIEPLETESTKRVAVREFGLACLKWGTGIGGLAGAIYGLLEYLSK